MAELLIAKGWTPPDQLALALEENLPDGWHVVVGPTIWGCTLDALVITPQGIVSIYARAWEGALRVDEKTGWRAELAPDDRWPLPDPGVEVRAATQALIRWLASEFPGLKLPITHLVVLTGPATPPPATDAPFPLVVPAATVQDGVARVLPETDAAVLLHTQQADLALALCERRLALHQRAQSPFVFRSGGALGASHAAWTIEDIAAHINKAPEDGIFHLANGTLARWFEQEGAEHLAVLARNVQRTYPRDPHAAVEVLLQGTGAVTQPGVVIYPNLLDLGAVVAGAECAKTIRIVQHGRGYVFGTLTAEVPWLHMEPDTFGGPDTSVLIRADTNALLIGGQPIDATIHMVSPVAEAVSLSVRIRVVAAPSAMTRRVLRPMQWAAASALLAAVLLGLQLAAGGDWSAPSSALAAAGVACWAVVGIAVGVRRVNEPHALMRWLITLSIWATATWAGAVLLLWALSHLAVELSGWTQRVTMAGVVCTAMLAGWAASRDALPARPHERAVRWSKRLSLGVAVLAAAVLVVTAVQRDDVHQAARLLQQWVEQQVAASDARLAGIARELQVRYYDRRAPSAAPVLVLPTVTPAPIAPTPEE